MSGLNRFFYPVKYQSREQFVSLGIKCVFISYQKSDRDAAKKVADYLIQADIDVYIDVYDKELKFHHQNNNPKDVTTAICNGINNSSHMLTIISPNTLSSTWVPFEIGYGYDKTDLSVLCLKGIPKGKLPEYVRTAKIVRDVYDLNNVIENLTGNKKELLIEAQKMFDWNNVTNPLNDVMDSLNRDIY